MQRVIAQFLLSLFAIVTYVYSKRRYFANAAQNLVWSHVLVLTRKVRGMVWHLNWLNWVRSLYIQPWVMNSIVFSVGQPASDCASTGWIHSWVERSWGANSEFEAIRTHWRKTDRGFCRELHCWTPTRQVSDFFSVFFLFFYLYDSTQSSIRTTFTYCFPMDLFIYSWLIH